MSTGGQELVDLLLVRKYQFFKNFENSEINSRINFRSLKFVNGAPDISFPQINNIRF